MKQSINNWPCLIDITDEPTNPPKNSSKSSNPIIVTLESPQPKTTNNSDVSSRKDLKNNKTTTETAKVAPQTTQKLVKTFAQAVTNLCDIPSSQLPQPVLKGDNLAIEIPEEEYVAGMETCKHNLHARIIWPKGSTPLTVFDLRAKLAVMWKNLGEWGISSLGSGYYELIFTSLEDIKRVRSIASWNLNPGVLKLFAWTRDFSLNNQNTSSAQVWLRIYGLAQEYWRPKIMFAIASSVGTPICTDVACSKPMIQRTFGQFARVLVDMDITQELRYKVLVERKGFAFFVDLDYENMPGFCTHCRKVGHYVENCRVLNNNARQADAEKPKKAKNVNTRSYVQVNDGRTKQGNKVDDPIVVDEVNTDKGKAAIIDKSPEKAGTSRNANETDILNENRFEALNAGDDDQFDVLNEM